MLLTCVLEYHYVSNVLTTKKWKRMNLRGTEKQKEVDPFALMKPRPYHTQLYLLFYVVLVETERN